MDQGIRPCIYYPWSQVWGYFKEVRLQRDCGNLCIISLRRLARATFIQVKQIYPARVRLRSLVVFLIIGSYTDGFGLEAQLPVALGTPTVEILDDVMGRL